MMAPMPELISTVADWPKVSFRSEREVQHRADEHLAPADLVGEPAPGIGADDGANAGAHQHRRRLAEGELPRHDQEGEHEADQKVVEEFQRIADHRGGNDLLLVAGQAYLPIEDLEHGVSPYGACSLFGGRRACGRPMLRTLRFRQPPRQVPGLPVETP